MRSVNSFPILLTVVTTGLMGCAKSASPANDAGTAAPTPGVAQAAVTSPLLGTSLCTDSAAHCSSFQLTLPPHEITGYLQNGGEVNTLLATAAPNVLKVKIDSSGLVLTLSVPDQDKSEEFEIEIPKSSDGIDFAEKTQQESVVSAFNASSSSSIYAYAQASQTSSTNRRVKVFIAKVSQAEKAAAGTTELPAYEIAPSVEMGQTSVRGAYQEVTIPETKVDLNYLSELEQMDLKSAQKRKAKYPDGEWTTAVTVYFQDGHLVEPPSPTRGYGKVEASKDFCFIRANVSVPAAGSNEFALGGVITLVTGSRSYGPVNASGSPAAAFSQSSILGIQSTGAASFNVPGKGFNKFGNGRSDSKELFSLGCTSKKPAELSVNTIILAFGKRNVEVSYPRANIVEAYIDEQRGVDQNLGQISYQEKRLDRAVGEKITTLKDISVDDPAIGNVAFQDGQPVVGDVNPNGGAVCYLPNHLAKGVSFKLAKAWPNTVQIGEVPPVSVGAVFTTDNKLVDRMSVSVAPSWFDAPAKVTAHPELLDAKAIRDCFGNYVAISK